MVAARRWETNRVEAFSDGVFAIAITLLVLEIHIGPEAFEHLLRGLLDQWPAYLAYVTSFLTVGSVWIAHHDLYGLAILAGIFIFPKLAAAAYLLVAIRGVLVSMCERV